MVWTGSNPLSIYTVSTAGISIDRALHSTRDFTHDGLTALGCQMKCMGWIALSALAGWGMGCSKNECLSEAGCDTGEMDLEPTGPVTVSVKWHESTILRVEVAGMVQGWFGIVGEGWEGESCPDGPYCHQVFEGANYFSSQRFLGAEWDGTLDNDQTWLHREGLPSQVWAVLSNGGRCQGVGGENEELYVYFEQLACPAQ
jgi:hypothetical protein